MCVRVGWGVCCSNVGVLLQDSRSQTLPIHHIKSNPNPTSPVGSFDTCHQAPTLSRTRARNWSPPPTRPKPCNCVHCKRVPLTSPQHPRRAGGSCQHGTSSKSGAAGRSCAARGLCLVLCFKPLGQRGGRFPVRGWTDFGGARACGLARWLPGLTHACDCAWVHAWPTSSSHPNHSAVQCGSWRPCGQDSRLRSRPKTAGTRLQMPGKDLPHLNGGVLGARWRGAAVASS